MNGCTLTKLLLFILPAMTLLSACGQNPVDPQGFFGRTGGCGNFLVYKFNNDLTDAVVVQADAAQLSLDRTPREFSLPHSAFDVRIDRFSGPAYAHYCDDVMESTEPKVTRFWKAVSGTVRVAAGDVPPPGSWETYPVVVSLHNVTFQDQFGDQVVIKELDFGSVVVGWLPG